jgi:hypothetical protein
VYEALRYYFAVSGGAALQRPEHANTNAQAHRSKGAGGDVTLWGGAGLVTPSLAQLVLLVERSESRRKKNSQAGTGQGMWGEGGKGEGKGEGKGGVGGGAKGEQAVEECVKRVRVQSGGAGTSSGEDGYADVC